MMDIRQRIKNGMLWPRRREVFTHRNFVVSAALTVAAALCLNLLDAPALSASVRVIEVASPVISFTGFAFAVAMGSIAIVLALPLSRTVGIMLFNGPTAPRVNVYSRDDGTLTLSNEPASEDDLRRSDYSDLIFVFSWTAVASTTASACVLVWALSFGNETVLQSEVLAANLLAALSAGTVLYTVLQMLASVRTAFQVSEIVAKSFRAEVRRSSDRLGGS